MPASSVPGAALTGPVFESKLRARSYELDAFGHVNHAVYLNWFELARFEALESGGFPLHWLAEQGWGVHVVRVEVDFRQETRLGDRLVLRTWADSARNSSMTLRQQALALDGRGAGEGSGSPGSASGAPGGRSVVAEATVVVVWVGPDRRPIRIPEVVRKGLGLDR